MNNRLHSVLLVLLLVFSSKAGAVIQASIDTLNGLAVTQDIIASDPARAGLPVSATVDASSNLLPASESSVFRVRFSLLDQNLTAQTLLLPGGGTDTELVVTQTISFPVFPGGIPSWSGGATFTGSLVPATRLRPGDHFYVRAILERNDGGTWTLREDQTSADAGIIWHFPSTNSNDASPNTNVRLTSVAMNSPYNFIIRNVAGQETFRVMVHGKARRYDHFSAVSPGSGNVTIPLRWTLRDLSNNVDVPLVASTGIAGVDLAEFAVASPNSPVETLFQVPVDVLPQNWADIDPMRAYELRVEAGHAGEAVFTQDSTRSTTPANWLVLSGKLKFANFTTTFDALNFDPIPGLSSSPDPSAHAEGTLEIFPGHGHLPGHAGHTFGGSLAVKILLNGDAVYTGTDVVNVSGPVNDTAVVNGITVKRAGISLDATGASAGMFEVKFPRGMSYATTAGTRRMKTKWQASGVPLPLNADLVVQPWVLSTSNFYIALERLPLVFAVPSVTVNFQTGRFSFTPSQCLYDTFVELGTLESYTLAPAQIDWPADKLLHAGNDQVFRLARTISGDTFTVSAAEDGAAFIDYARLTFVSGAYFTHFPRGLGVTASGIGLLASQYVIQNDVVNSASLLGGVTLSHLRWDPNNPPEKDKPTCNAALSVASLSNPMTASGGQLAFRPDGSLAASVVLGSGALNWGIAKNSPLTYTQNMTLASEGKLLLPSHFLPWRDAALNGLAFEHRAAGVHLAGRSGSGALTWEHPQSVAYQQGDLDYAGMNFRAADAGGGHTGVTVMGGVATSSYPLEPETKFYVRPGGVSGRIQSNQNFSTNIYGMQMNLEGMKLAYLSNVVLDTALNGGLSVGIPDNQNVACGFSLDFKGLRLFADGSLDRGVLNEGQGAKTLKHWKTAVTPISMEFKQPDPCDSSNGFLALGVETVLPSLTAGEVLRGVLGFRGADGSIVAREDADNDFDITGVDSRLAVPGNIKVKGPGSSFFTITPVTGAYLSRWPGPGGDTGFSSLAGAMDVPFFENLNVHLHADPPVAGVEQVMVHVMQPPESLGPFTLTQFDPTNSGMPGTISKTDYRTLAAYFPHAKKNWLGLIDFDYPVEWRRELRQFQTKPTPSPVEGQPPKAGVDVDLKVASVLSRVRSMTPNSADLKFNAVLGGNPLAGTSAAELIGGALNGIGASAVLDALDGAVPVDLKAAFQKIASFEEALADAPDKLVRDPLTLAVGHVRGQLGLEASQSSFKAELANYLASTFSANSPNGAIGIPASWKQAVFKRLDEVKSAATDIRSVIQDINTVKALANAMAGASEPPGQNSADTPDDVQQMLNNAYGLLSYVISTADTIKSGINAIDLQLDANAWNAIITQALPQMPELPLSMSDAELVDVILLHFLGSDPAAQLGEEMRTHLSDVHDSVRSGIDEALGGMNEMAQGAVGPLSPLLGAPGMTDFRFAKIDGSAQINGDSLHQLRLDADIDIKGTDFKMNGYVLYKDVESDTPQGACRASQGIAAELTLGASTTVPLGQPDFPGGQVVPSTIEAEAKFAFSAEGSLNGLAGRLGMTHPGTGANLGALKLKQAEFGFGFGGGDGYVYGKGAGKTKLYDVEAALFFGRACYPYDVLSRVDQQAAELLDDERFNDLMGRGHAEPTPVYGFYGFGYGAISLTSLLGIPPTCMLNIKAGAGIGAFYFFRENNEPHQDAELDYYTTIGLRQDLGLSGEILCVADINARIGLIGAVPSNASSVIDLPSQLQNATGIVGSGKADFDVTLGVSPFDVTLSKTLRMNFSYSPLKFDIDF